MREKIKINDSWYFQKGGTLPTNIEGAGESVSLPHTYNAKDGQDGGNDYYRGVCVYTRALPKCIIRDSEEYYLEFRGVNSKAAVYLNGEKIGEHIGGYSTFRVRVQNLKTDNLLSVVVDNSPDVSVYPYHADFTFYGGIYRDVYLIGVPRAHFDLKYYGSDAIFVSSKINDRSAELKIRVMTENTVPRHKIRYTVRDKDGNTVAERLSGAMINEECLTIDNPHLWDGRANPYLYTATVQLLDGEQVLDEVSTRFGIRSFYVDVAKGFFLNGRHYPLRGVSRHQDRLGIGNALLPEHHIEDMELIRELGATAVRLAHYQHDSFFYDLCDKYGICVWAEIPYISNHKAEGRDNTVYQLTELILQNYNHPSIVFWGLSNEITMSGAEDRDLIENHMILNDLAHSLDNSRLTAVAALTTCPTDAEYLRIPDVISYNHYFGWYGGTTDMNGEWLDKFHKEYPNIPLGVSEYGCEGLNWHSSTPTQGDYTEEYQAYYHEQLAHQLFTRDYLHSTFVWNMFDFGADARCEGGEHGQNHKGLVTFDRKYKKDAFYIYKAYLSKEPFVHIASKRYIDRVEPITRVTVYSNFDEVELLVNGVSLGKKKSDNHVFRFEVKNEGESFLTAISGPCHDSARIRKVDKPNESYILRESHAVLNWFDITEPEGKLSLNSKIEDILKNEDGVALFNEFMSKSESVMKKNGDGSLPFNTNSPEMLSMLGSFTLLRLTSMMGMMDISFTKDELLTLNKQLNEIDKV